MNAEERLRANVRSVAVEAERHWWTSKLLQFADGLRQEAASADDHAVASVLASFAASLDRLRMERAR